MSHALSEAGAFGLPLSLVRFSSLLRRRSKACAGFTLVEMMVTLAVAMILAMLAVPNFHRQLLSHRLDVAKQGWWEAFTTARMAAVRGNMPSELCTPSNNGSASLSQACPAGVGAVVRLAGSQPIVVRAPLAGLDATVTVHGAPVALRFDGNGLAHAVNGLAPYSGVVLDLCSPGLSADNHRQISVAAGAIVTTATTTGACP